MVQRYCWSEAQTQTADLANIETPRSRTQKIEFRSDMETVFDLHALLEYRQDSNNHEESMDTLSVTWTDSVMFLVWITIDLELGTLFPLGPWRRGLRTMPEEWVGWIHVPCLSVSDLPTSLQ
jgi:hypothetical protein